MAVGAESGGAFETQLCQFRVVVDEPERRANHRPNIDIGSKGTPFELVPLPKMGIRKTFTGQNGWLDGRLELTPRPALSSRGALPTQRMAAIPK